MAAQKRLEGGSTAPYSRNMLLWCTPTASAVTSAATPPMAFRTETEECYSNRMSRLQLQWCCDS